MTDKTSPNKLWGGRFDSSPDELMEAMNASIAFDKRLYRHDIQGSLVHAAMLARNGIIEDSDAKEIRKGLITILAEIEEGKFEFSAALEDIHMNIEARLEELIGEPAGRLHTARSRNDQVATDFRLWVRDQADAAIRGLSVLIRELLSRAEEGADFIMPGFTHLQCAQPITWGHHLMAYVEMFGRDIGRFRDARSRMNESPLGAAALAGTPYPVDRDETAKALGFDRPMANSIDAVSDRDFALEYLSAAAICVVHLSRIAEEIVFWTSAQFKFASLGDRFTTGSSIMPQKRNPDAAELARAKTGRIIGALVALLAVVKGLPLAYSKDLQEDKEQVFDAADNLNLVISVMAGMVGDLAPDRVRMAKAAEMGNPTATDLADWLVRNLDMPFRKAHRVTGQLVLQAETKGVQLSELELRDMKAVCGGITEEARELLRPGHSVAARTSYGGTAPDLVRTQIASWRERLKCDGL